MVLLIEFTLYRGDVFYWIVAWADMQDEQGQLLGVIY